MSEDNIPALVPGADESDDSFVIETVRRSRLLLALQSEPATASELAAKADVSRSTVHRATSTLSELNLIEKVNGVFQLTGYGTVLAHEVEEFHTRIQATRHLEPFLSHVELSDIPIEPFADATVIEPRARQPHYSVRRIMELIEDTDRLRVFSTVISPIYVEIAHREMMNGMEAEAIFDEETIDLVTTEYAEETMEAIQSGHFSVFSHPDPPFELFLFDDRMGMAAHDEHGIARVFVESTADPAIAWGERLYDQYRSEAQPLAT